MKKIKLTDWICLKKGHILGAIKKKQKIICGIKNGKLYVSNFKLRIKVASDFKWEDLDEKTAESMLNLNAPALLLGYMRPIVANITNSSNFPAYNLPFINFKE